MAEDAHDTRVATLEALLRAFERRDAEAVAELVHPDATVSEAASGDREWHGREGISEYMSEVESRVVVATFASMEPIADDSVLVVGRIQRQRDDNTMTDTSAVWVITFRDGLIWRTATFPDEAEARANAAFGATT